MEAPENKVAKMATLDKRFTAHTAAKTGEPERTIQRDAARQHSVLIWTASLEHRWTGPASLMRWRVCRQSSVHRSSTPPLMAKRLAQSRAFAAPEPNEPRQGNAKLEKPWKQFRDAMERASSAGRRAFLDEYQNKIEALSRHWSKTSWGSKAN